MRRLPAVLALLPGLLLAGCGGGSDSAAPVARPVDTSLTTPATSPTSHPVPPSLSSCPRISAGQPDGTPLVVGVWASAARHPETALVLLPDAADPRGLCDWSHFARAAARAGYPAVAADLCESSAGACTDAMTSDPAQYVDVLASRARKLFHTPRVVVIGALAGGAVAVRAAATDARVDAWVDLSETRDALGPLAKLGGKLRVRAPGMVVASGTAAAKALGRRFALASGALLRIGPDRRVGIPLLVSSKGELTPLGRDVLAFTGPGPPLHGS